MSAYNKKIILVAKFIPKIIKKVFLDLKKLIINFANDFIWFINTILCE